MIFTLQNKLVKGMLAICTSPEAYHAAKRAAMIYSLLGTCKLKKVEPFAWLKNVFEVLSDWKANRLEELLH